MKVEGSEVPQDRRVAQVPDENLYHPRYANEKSEE